MEINTKYEIGQKLFWVDKYDGVYRVQYDDIKRINIGGKAFEMYEIGNTTRSEHELFEAFKDAKNKALEKQKEWNEKVLKIIEEYTPPYSL